jgi:uncharacterized paraquat-inducible protein A
MVEVRCKNYTVCKHKDICIVHGVKHTETDACKLPCKMIGCPANSVCIPVNDIHVNPLSWKLVGEPVKANFSIPKEERHCSNCKYWGESISEDPCRRCFSDRLYDNWTPRQ